MQTLFSDLAIDTPGRRIDNKLSILLRKKLASEPQTAKPRVARFGGVVRRAL